jgi:hypothetical protein
MIEYKYNEGEILQANCKIILMIHMVSIIPQTNIKQQNSLLTVVMVKDSAWVM